MFVGAYEVVTHVATGGMADIYAARDRNGRIVVVKQMLEQFAQKPEFVEMFFDEGRTVSLLRHPNIVEMYDFGFTGEIPYLAMEYLHGVDVRAILKRARERREKIPIDVALAIVRGAAAGLHHAHEARSLDGRPLSLVHRDVSPQNIVVSFDGRVKVIDFGIAKTDGRMHETRAGSLKGKIPYMAPEQVRTGVLDRRTDVYALGVVLYELLAGRRPYAVDSAEPQGEFALMMSIVSHQVTQLGALRSGVPPILQAAVMRAFSAKPADRFATAADLAGALDEDGDDEQLLATYLERLFGDRPSLEELYGTDDIATELRLIVQLGDVAEEEDIAISAEPSVLVEQAVSLVTLPARIDETFHGEARGAALRGTVILDLSAVTRISSFGVREWFAFHRAIPEDVTLFLSRCPEVVVAQAGMMRGFFGRAHVASFFAPHVCDHCGHHVRVLVDCERDPFVGAPPITCPRCAMPARLDDDPSYASSLQRFAGVALPAAVRAELVGDLDRSTGSAFEMRVEGHRTTVQLVRPLAPGFRYAKVFSGLEGAVEVELAHATIEPEAYAELVTALRLLAPLVRELVVRGAPLDLAKLLDAAQIDVRQVSAVARCTRCAKTRAVILADVAAPIESACAHCHAPLVLPSPEVVAVPPRRWPGYLAAAAIVIGASVVGVLVAIGHS